MMQKVSRRTALRGFAATGAAAWLGFPALAQAQGGRFVARMERDVGVLDPPFRTGWNDGNIIRNVCQRLVALKPGTTETELDAAEEFGFVSDTLIEFKLKPGLKFTGGHGEMTAEDVKWSYERYLTEQRDGKPSAYVGDWSALDQVEVTGPYSGRIHLKNPAPALLLTTLVEVSGCIASRQATEALAGSTGAALVGTGAYMIERWDANQQLVLRANPDYAGPQPRFEECVLKVVPDMKTAELAFRANEVDFTQIDTGGADAMKDIPDTEVIERPGMFYIWIGMNMEKPPLDKLEVRQAIRAALDIDEIVLAGYNGKAPRANAMIQPVLLGYWKDAPNRARDLDLARQLLSQAGVDGLQLKLLVLNQPAYKTMAEVAQGQLAEAGIDLQLDVRDSGTFFAAGKGDPGKDLDLAMQRFSAKMDATFSSQWFVSSQIGNWNWQRWASPEYDRLHQLAGSTMDPAAREAAFIEMQKLQDDTSAFVWLTYGAYAYATKAWLRPAILPNGNDLQYRHFTST